MFLPIFFELRFDAIDLSVVYEDVTPCAVVRNESIGSGFHLKEVFGSILLPL